MKVSFRGVNPLSDNQAHILVRISIPNEYRLNWGLDRVISPRCLPIFFPVINKSKCAFGVFEVEYLGHIVILDGVHVDLKKIEALKDWPHPKNLKSLISFLGVIGYYKNFIKKYGKIATLITTLL
jgi:hypothetical protein